MINKRIEQKAKEILDELKIDKVPVPVERIALKMDLAVQPTDLGQGVSGALYIKDGKSTIGVNINDGRQRRRFTIAHELGHYVLHRHLFHLFIDEPKQISTLALFRDGNSSTGDYETERAANSFAAALLMPAHFIERESKHAKGKLLFENDEDFISYLSKKFDVSEIAMTYRLTNLNLM